MLDIDGSGSASPLTDGLLIVRWLFGFRSNPLISGLIDPDCSRCTAGEVEDYLESLAGDLDVDGNGAEEPLADGVIALRWLLGFHGQALIGGAVGNGCTRCTAGEIETFLDAL